MDFQGDYPISSNKYGDTLKIQCLYNILHAYSSLLRPGVYLNDNKLCFLFTMCRLIDRSYELGGQTKETNGSATQASSTVDVRLWNLERLVSEFDDYFVDTNTAATPVVRGVSTTDRMNRLESLVIDPEHRFI